MTPGITCALIPASHDGVVIGRRHHPLNAAFQNGPTSGNDVFIPIDWVIGGQAQVGKGWRMLMECLAAGRAISLPSSSVGMGKMAVRGTGAYAAVRRQFNMPIGKFEGVQEALARMGANLYLMDAARTLAAHAVDLGEKPAVISAIVKYHVTERGRALVNDGMDILGGKGICIGPKQFPRQRLPANSHRHHRRRRQHPHAQPDHLRPGRHPRASVCAQGNGRRQRKRRPQGLARFRLRPSLATSALCWATWPGDCGTDWAARAWRPCPMPARPHWRPTTAP